MDDKQILIDKLKGDIARLKAEKKALGVELKHEKERHRLEMENLVLKVEGELRDMQQQASSRFPVLSQLLTQFAAVRDEIITEALLPPDPPDPQD